MLLATAIGRELVGAWLTRSDPQAQGHLLHALSIALHVYVLRRGVSAEDRRWRPELLGGGGALVDDRSEASAARDLEQGEEGEDGGCDG